MDCVGGFTIIITGIINSPIFNETTELRTWRTLLPTPRLTAYRMNSKCRTGTGHRSLREHHLYADAANTARR